MNPPRAPWTTTQLVVAWTIGLAGAAAVGLGVAWALTKPRHLSGPVPTEDQAIDAAISQLGTDAETAEVARVAYRLAYPTAPYPPDGTYTPSWARIVRKVQELLARPVQKVAPPAVEDLPAGDGTAAKVSAWLESLSAEQRSSTREIVGSQVWDPVEVASSKRDDEATRAALLSFKLGIEAAARDSKWRALKMYSQLKDTLGPKLDEFGEILSATVGAPEVL